MCTSIHCSPTVSWAHVFLPKFSFSCTCPGQRGCLWCGPFFCNFLKMFAAHFHPLGIFVGTLFSAQILFFSFFLWQPPPGKTWRDFRTIFHVFILLNPRCRVCRFCKTEGALLRLFPVGRNNLRPLKLAGHSWFSVLPSDPLSFRSPLFWQDF